MKLIHRKRGSMADFVNGSFEILGGVFILLSCLRAYKDKQVKGISILMIGFFTAWGFWNLYYYPSLGQIWSFIGGLGVVSANTLYVSMLIYYSVHYDSKK